MNVAGRFASKRVTFLFLYLCVSVSISFLPFRVYDIVIIYTIFFSYCRQDPTVSIQNHTSISLSLLLLSIPPLSYPLALFLSLSPFLSLLITNTQTLLLVAAKGVLLFTAYHCRSRNIGHYYTCVQDPWTN